MFLIFSFFKLFSKKIIALLFLELMFLVCLLLFSSGYSSASICFSFMLILCIFMVIESVLGLSLLVSSSRESSFLSEKMKSLTD